MNRLIKYRGFWSDTKKSIKNFMEDYLLTVLNDNKNIIVHQFTGLLDKNDIEIYEGDILKFHWKAMELGESEQWTGEVFWDSEWAGFFISRQGQWTIKEIRNPEVIGNIYENRDLLK